MFHGSEEIYPSFLPEVVVWLENPSSDQQRPTWAIQPNVLCVVVVVSVMGAMKGTTVCELPTPPPTKKKKKRTCGQKSLVCGLPTYGEKSCGLCT